MAGSALTAPSFDPSFAPPCDPSFAPPCAPSFAPPCDPSFAPNFDPASAPNFDPAFAPPFDPASAPNFAPASAPNFDPAFDPASAPPFAPASAPPFAPPFDPPVDPSFAPLFDPPSDPSVDRSSDLSSERGEAAEVGGPKARPWWRGAGASAVVALGVGLGVGATACGKRDDRTVANRGSGVVGSGALTGQAVGQVGQQAGLDGQPTGQQTGQAGQVDQVGQAGQAGQAAGSHGAAAPTLHGIAQLRGRPHLVEGTRRIAVRFENEAFWYESSAGTLAARNEVGLAVAGQLAELGGTAPDVMLGLGPIVIGGEHDHEQRVRVGPPAKAIALEGWPDQIAVLPDGREVWRYEHAAHRQLAIVDARGEVSRPSVALERIGPEVESASPVSARVCRQPQVIDLAGNGTLAVALVVECHGEAPVRLVLLRPAATVITLPSRSALGFDPTAVALGKTGAIALAGGGRDGGIVVARIDATGKLARQPVPAALAKARGPSLVRDLEIADDGALWTLAADVVSRDAQPVALQAPDGTLLRPVTLALDAQLGITVLAQARDESAWLFAERPLTGGAIAIPPR